MMSMIYRLRIASIVRMVNCMIVLLLAVPVFAQPQKPIPDWYRKFVTIEPLVTAKQEVEKILGTGSRAVTGKSGSTVTYLVGDAVFEVTYSLGVCNGYLDKYRAEKGIVLDVDVTLKKPVAFSQIPIVLVSYQKVPLDDVVGRFTYVNLDLGERLDGNEMQVFSLQRFPRSELEKSFRCVS